MKKKTGTTWNNYNTTLSTFWCKTAGDNAMSQYVAMPAQPSRSKLHHVELRVFVQPMADKKSGIADGSNALKLGMPRNGSM